MSRPRQYDTLEEAREAKNKKNQESFEKQKAKDPEGVKSKRRAVNKTYYEKRKAQTQIFKETQLKAACEIAEEL